MKTTPFQKFTGLVLIGILSAATAQSNTLLDYGTTPNVTRPGGDQSAANQKLDFHTDLYTGRFNYRIPIEMPPARQGSEPEIALQYNSSVGNGWCGVGWDLDMGCIQRETRYGVPVSSGSYSDSYGFTFSFAGQSGRLVHASDGSYRPEINTAFLKFTYSGGYWVVTDRSGRQYTFGDTSGSRIAPGTPSGTFKWALSKIVDPNGNTTTVTYQTAGSDGQLYLYQITYNANVNSPAISANSTVTFSLDASRTDVPSTYLSGAKISTTRRLQNITVSNNGYQVRRYALQYTTSPSTQRSLLASVTEYGTDDASTLPPYTFYYSAMNNSFLSATNWSIDTQGNNSSAWWNSVGNNDIEMLDINGDGLPDRVMRKFNGQYTGFAVQLNNGHGFNLTTAWGPIANEQNTGTSDWNSPSLNIIEDLVDLNGDLLPDRVTQRQSSPGLFYVRTNSAIASTNTGFSSLISWAVTNETTAYSINQMQGVTTTDPSGGYESSVLLTDMNGDGLADRVMLGGTSGQFAVQLNQRGSFAGITHWTGVTAVSGANGGPSSYAPRAKDGYNSPGNYGGFYADLMDMNGDGLPDRVMIGGVQFNNGYGGFTSLQTWSGLSSGVYPTIMSVTDGAHYTALIDINGDGLPDRVTDNKNGTYSVQINTGSGFSSAVTWTGVSAGGYSPTTGWYAPRAWDGSGTRSDLMDVNGDGLPDRVLRGTSGNLQVQLNSGPFPDLLTEVDNGLGGYVTVAYTSANAYNNSDGSRPRLPMPVYVVTDVNVLDGIRMNGVTSYFYTGGLYDTYWREFRGFAIVDEYDPLNTLTETYFYQGGGLNLTTHGEYQDSRFKAGMPYDIVTYGLADGIHYSVYKETLNQIDQVQVDSSGVYFPYVKETFDIDNEATGSPRTTLTLYTYAVTGNNLAASTGNLLQENYQGEVAGVDYYFAFTPVTDPASPRYTTYTYAALSNPNIIDKPSSITISSDSEIFRQTTNVYDGTTGNLIRQGELVCPGTYATTVFTQDNYGNPKTITDPMGIVTKIDYDSTATFPWRKSTGALTNYTQFDSRSGNLLAATNEQGLVTANLYDVFLRLTNSATSTTPNGAATLWRKRIEYSLDGLYYVGADTYDYNYVRVLENDPANASTGYHENYTYLDGLGRPIQVRNQSETNGIYRVSDVFYDPRGNTEAQTYPLFQSGADYVQTTGTPEATYTAFDPIGRASTVYPCVNLTLDSYGYGTLMNYTALTGDTGSAVGPTSIAFKDGSNPWAMVVTDARGKVRKYLLDSLGRTNQIVEVTSQGNFTTTLAYNPANDLTNITDSAGNKISFFVDLLGNQVAMADPDMGFWQWTRDLDGRVKVQTDAKGQQIKFFYNDSAGRITRREGWSANNVCLSTNIWSYDNNGGDSSCTVYPGQLYKVTDDEGFQKFSYDVRNRALKSVRYLVKNGNSYTNQFTFDDADRQSSTIYPNGGPTITNLFDTGQHLKQVAQGTTNFYMVKGFNALEQLNGINFGNGVGTTLSYYSISRRLNQIISAKTTNVQNLTYSFDANNNVTGVADGVYSGNAKASIGNIVYDDLNRLTFATNASGSYPYAYTSIGNILTNKESGSGAYNYGTGGIRPHFVRTANGLWFTCDLNGNTVFRGNQRLDYDVNNHLYRVIGTNGIVTTFGYDANGARLWESSGTNALQVWIGNNYEEKNGLILYHIYADGRQVATFDKTGTNVYQYYHPDNLGSTSIQTDKNGNQIQNYGYSPFGQSRYTQSSTVFKVSRRYTGQVLDDATGLYYYNARYYDPVLARFIQPDDIIPDLSDPQTYNRYAYCVNNPLRFTDPTGHSFMDYVSGFFGFAQLRANANADEWATHISNRSGNLGFKSFAEAQNYVGEQKDPMGLNADVRLVEARNEAVSTMAEAATGLGGVYVNGITDVGAPGIKVAAVGAVGVVIKTRNLAKNVVRDSEVVEEGIYAFKEGDATYIGQSGNIPKRLKAHELSGKKAPGVEATVSKVSGGKTAREIAEHKKIQETTGGVPASQSPKVTNQRDPIGPNRQNLLNEKSE